MIIARHITPPPPPRKLASNHSGQWSHNYKIYNKFGLIITPLIAKQRTLGCLWWAGARGNQKLTRPYIHEWLLRPFVLGWRLKVKCARYAILNRWFAFPDQDHWVFYCCGLYLRLRQYAWVGWWRWHADVTTDTWQYVTTRDMLCG